MDQLDHVQELVETERATLVARHAHRLADRVPAGAIVSCNSCGGEIPEARRRALPGVCLCVDCQAALERGFR